MNVHAPQVIPALIVRQWLDIWDRVPTDPTEYRSPPPKHFYVFTMPASHLRRLSGVYPRTVEAGTPRTQDLGIQRRHLPERSENIAEFIRLGHPWAGMSERQRQSPNFADLQKPGWLPTAVLLNILRPGDSRPWGDTADDEYVTVEDHADGFAQLLLPRGFSGSEWEPSGAPPLEVIDGQHRLWAFDYLQEPGDYDLPVVAFCGLDLSWQAYLFWTINIKPKRINASLAFDLYPMLRTEDWLEKSEGPLVYRETRAQELTEILWSFERSPWHRLINMLGEGRQGVTQAAWIRSLTATYIKPFRGQGIQIGGLFGSRLGENGLALPWSRLQQAAYLARVWMSFADAVEEVQPEWVPAITPLGQEVDYRRTPFTSGVSLVNTDQGVRGILAVSNDLSVLQVADLGLAEWRLTTTESDSISSEALESATGELAHERAGEFLTALGRRLASFDWRTSAAEGLSREEQLIRQALRGSTGYREIRRLLLDHLAAGNDVMAGLARRVQELLGFAA